jgi:hypothetical protein
MPKEAGPLRLDETKINRSETKINRSVPEVISMI